MRGRPPDLSVALTRARPRRQQRLPSSPAATALVLAGSNGCQQDAADDQPNGETLGGEIPTRRVFGTDDLEFEPSRLETRAGAVEIQLIAEESNPHTFTIEELDDETVVAVSLGENETGTVELEAGDYTYYCSVPWHRERGMEGTLTATE